MVKLDLKRVGVMKMAFFMGLYGAFIGLIFGIFFSIFSVIANSLVPTGSSSIGGFGLWSLILFPLAFGVFNFLIAFILTPIFNFILKIIKGLEVELEEVVEEPTQSVPQKGKTGVNQDNSKVGNARINIKK